MGLFSKKNGAKSDTKHPPPVAPSADTPNAGADLRSSSGATAPAAEPSSSVGARSAPIASQQNHMDTRFAGYGKILSVLARDPRFSGLPLKQIAGLVGPALDVGQFAIAEAQRKAEAGPGAPVAVVLWAIVSDAVDRKLSDLNAPVSLAPQDWRSGDIPWLMLNAGSEQAVGAVLKSLSDKLPPGISFKTRVTDKEGKPRIGVVEFKERPPLE